MSDAERKPPQSAAAPSPFPPIADYAFLSNCHTGALVAPDGAIDWLCVPSFDSPSVFGSLLDREAGSFRLGPFGINHPTARVYDPGTNVLVTTWKTPTGWIVVRDALTMGPREHEDEITPHTRPPADDDADHMLVRTVECLDGSVEIELICEPVFDYGRAPAEWALVDGGTNAADATRQGADDPPPLRPRARHRGRSRARRVTSSARASGPTAPSRGPRSSPRPRMPRTPSRGSTPRCASGAAGSGGRAFPTTSGAIPIQRSALAIKGLTYMPTGATVAALTTSLPETPGGERNWDYRYTWMRDTTFTLQALHYLNLEWEADEFMQFVADDRAERGRLAADHVRDRRAARPDRVDARRPLRLRGSPPRPDRQRRLRPAPERRLRRGARLVPPPHPAEQPPPARALADRPDAGRVRHERLAGARPGDLGGARRAAALRLLEAHVLGRARPGREARRDPRRPRAAGDLERDRGGDPRGHPRARRQRARRAAPALRDRRARRVDCSWRRSSGSCRTTTSVCRSRCWPSPRS